MPFAGMIGRALTKQLLKNEVAKNAKASSVSPSSFVGSGKFLFVAHPACCEKCKLLGMTPHFFNTPDVAFITHPNCLCATIEAPSGLTPEQLMAWAQNPVGKMRFGFNYGVPLKEIGLTNRNYQTNMLKWVNKMRPDAPYSPRTSRKLRSIVSEAQKEKVRRDVEEGRLGKAKDITNAIKGQIKRAQTLLRKKQERIPVTTITSPVKRKSAIKTLKNNGTTTWNPNSRKKSSSNAEIKYANALLTQSNRNATALTTQKNSLKTGRLSSSSLARKRMDEERKRRKALEKLMKQKGFV